MKQAVKLCDSCGAIANPERQLTATDNPNDVIELCEDCYQMCISGGSVTVEKRFAKTKSL